MMGIHARPGVIGTALAAALVVGGQVLLSSGATSGPSAGSVEQSSHGAGSGAGHPRKVGRTDPEPLLPTPDLSPVPAIKFPHIQRPPNPADRRGVDHRRVGATPGCGLSPR